MKVGSQRCKQKKFSLVSHFPPDEFRLRYSLSRGCRGQRTKPRATQGEGICVPTGLHPRGRWTGNQHQPSPQGSVRPAALTQHWMDSRARLPETPHPERGCVWAGNLNAPYLGGPQEAGGKTALSLKSCGYEAWSSSSCEETSQTNWRWWREAGKRLASGGHHCATKWPHPRRVPLLTCYVRNTAFRPKKQTFPSRGLWHLHNSNAYVLWRIQQTGPPYMEASFRTRVMTELAFTYICGERKIF